MGIFHRVPDKQIRQLLLGQKAACKWARKINRTIRDEQATLGIIRDLARMNNDFSNRRYPGSPFKSLDDFLKASEQFHKERRKERDAFARKTVEAQKGRMRPFRRFMNTISSKNYNLFYEIALLSNSLDGKWRPGLIEAQAKELGSEQKPEARR
ncbi:Uncharacterised protein [uncultured archaeon]|nr:Uncharacterised protein [uncultured archaeon]